jgi:hypothetical protein
MSLQLPIGGILCDIELDENEFVNVFIANTEPPQKLLMQWIVRGKPDLARALDLAERIIELRLNGYSIMHRDPEGRIEYVKDPDPQRQQRH